MEVKVFLRLIRIVVFTIIFVFAGFYDHADALEFADFGPYSGKIIDANTGEPIEGVVVIVSWDRHFGGGSTFMDAQETITNKKGEFYLSGIWVLNPWTRLISEAELGIYKSEYSTVGIGPWKKWEELDSAVIFKDMVKREDGKLIFLLKRRTPEERRQALPYDPAMSVPLEKKSLLLHEMERASQFLYPSEGKND